MRSEKETPDRGGQDGDEYFVHEDDEWAMRSEAEDLLKWWAQKIAKIEQRVNITVI